MNESLEPARSDVYTFGCNDTSTLLLTRKGDPVRVFTVSDLNLTDPFFLVTTDFSDGPGDFENAVSNMLVAFDENGQEISGVFGTGSSVWMNPSVDFRNWGLFFDWGFSFPMHVLDRSNASGKDGFIAYARGRNEYLPGALCETEPAVQAYWLSCLREMLDAGVDGIDFREENHSTHTDYPEYYGYNQVVLDRCARLGAVNRDTISRVRGDAYTDFLRQAKALISSRGKRMRINFQVDWYREDKPIGRQLAYPGNLNFQWRRWIEEGLLDEALIRIYAFSFDNIFTDDLAGEIIKLCGQRQFPVYINHYMHYPHGPKVLKDNYHRVHVDTRFAGFIFYETASFLKFTENDGCEITMDEFNNLIT